MRKRRRNALEKTQKEQPMDKQYYEEARWLKVYDE